MKCMGLVFFMCWFLLLSEPISISAHFFPNVSSIPDLLNKTKNAWDEFQNLGGCRPGETLHGLSKLKNYFKQFGYIPESNSFNFTDYFDDVLESAIKTYQKNFNLNVTGELDGQTLRQIQLPRCGMPDIINGSTSMNSRTPSSNSHLHTVSHYSFFPGKPQWPVNRRDLSYAFAPGNQLTGEVKGVFGNAFRRWAEVTPLTFREVNSYFSADIRIGFFAGDHGDGEPFDGLLGTLAHAFSPPSGLFHLDGDENWVVSGDIRTSTLVSAIDLESVAVHEIGHLLGLGHSSAEDSIMFPTISSRTRKVDLAVDDINGIQELYGPNPNPTGNSSTTAPTTTPTPVQERETTPSGAHALSSTWWSLIVLVAVELFIV